MSELLELAERYARGFLYRASAKDSTYGPGERGFDREAANIMLSLADALRARSAQP